MPESIKELCAPHKTWIRHKFPLVPLVVMVTVWGTLYYLFPASSSSCQASNPQICGSHCAPMCLSFSPCWSPGLHLEVKFWNLRMWLPAWSCGHLGENRLVELMMVLGEMSIRWQGAGTLELAKIGGWWHKFHKWQDLQSPGAIGLSQLTCMPVVPALVSFVWLVGIFASASSLKVSRTKGHCLGHWVVQDGAWAG
jgi:hypothetical protein